MADELQNVARITPPLVGFGSFTTFLNYMAEVGGAPAEITAATIPAKTFSGSTRYELLRALRFLDLIDERSKTKHERIDPLISAGTRKDAWVGLLKEKYPEAFTLPLHSATPQMIARCFDQYNLDNTSAKKAQAFFIHAAKTNGLPLHALVLKSARVRSTALRKKRVDRVKAAAAVSEVMKEFEKPDTGADDPSKVEARLGQISLRLHPAVQAWIDEMPPRDQPWDRNDFMEWLDIFKKSCERAYKI